MTEPEWLAATDPDPAAYWAPLKGKFSERRHRLYVCGLCRVRHPDLDPAVQDALDLAERYADGMAGWEELAEAEERAVRRLRSAAGRAAYFASWALHPHAGKGSGCALSEVEVSEVAAHARLLRCIHPNPFRPVAIDPSWVTTTVRALATGVYADRAWDRLPVLADALEDAGCDNAGVLAHCRSDGMHVRGCWAADLVLGKT